ncbi:response regulator transcription factor [Gordonia sp. TBRC 11910]|uniref:Response regulator transcription factor n=1 Tax=Gordonia asplenii TaxID=2725283 RepID=A0A848L3T3_9ACTN|nr:LuxR C-terminal-related transcriptional regulator [Gordonia asplenii]NMO05092.1 response regulator transcription factor [Gordonia asplenii]
MTYTIATPTTTLSTREVEVLTHWLHTESKSVVAERLFISESTVHTHLARIREKYSLAGRPANSKISLLIRAIEDGLCTIDDMSATLNERAAV